MFDEDSTAHLLNDTAPSSDGLWLMDMFSNDAKLVISLAAVLALQQAPSGQHQQQESTEEELGVETICFSWFSKPQVSCRRLACTVA